MVVRCVRGIRSLQPCSNCAGDASKLGYVVPEVRIRILSVHAEDVRDRDDDATRARGGVLELRHERVVADAVLDHETRLRDGEPVARARLEEMGVGIRVREDGGDRDVRAADLRDHVAVNVGGRDDVDGFCA